MGKKQTVGNFFLHVYGSCKYFCSFMAKRESQVVCNLVWRENPAKTNSMIAYDGSYHGTSLDVSLFNSLVVHVTKFRVNSSNRVF